MPGSQQDIDWTGRFRVHRCILALAGEKMASSSVQTRYPTLRNLRFISFGVQDTSLVHGALFIAYTATQHY